jgi:hypothetical protein|tara:strand:+ start:1374 stop:1556 length:183 start_codon:yes stop_codon:yes gene_type:complete
MITIRKNPNFTQWFQVFAFGKLIDELNTKAKAMSLARTIARNNNTDFYHMDEKRIKVKSI